MQPSTNSTQTPAAALARPGAVHALTLFVVGLATALTLAATRVMIERPNQTRRVLQRQGLRRGGELDADSDEQGNVITDNLGMIVFGILAIVVIGGLISGLGTRVVNFVSKQLGV